MAGDDLIIDLTNYKDRVGNRVVPGRYTVVVEDAESDTAKSGNPMVNLWLRVQGGEFDGATIVDRLVLTEKSLFRVVGFMQAVGLPTPRKRLKMNVRGFIGRTLDIDVEDGEPYNGRVKSEVRGYMRAVGAGAAAESTDLDDLPGEDDLSAFDGTAEAEIAEEAAPKAEEKVEVQTTIDTDADEVDLDSIDLG
jgi:hypothetical protein